MDCKSFDYARIAEGYLKRPWLHKQVLTKICLDENVSAHFDNGLDVGCGAGLSTKALKMICNRVTGTDISEEMIHICMSTYQDPNYQFYVAKAEETRIPEVLYDIVTAAGVVNWVNKKIFLNNMLTVMKSNGLMIIYDFEITDRMFNNDLYTDWYQNKYLQIFPKPQRNESIWSQKELVNGFQIESQVTYELPYEFDVDDFIEFMMIQSNVNIKLESTNMSVVDAKKWMSESLYPIFAEEKRKLFFKGYYWIIKRC